MSPPRRAAAGLAGPADGQIRATTTQVQRTPWPVAIRDSLIELLIEWRRQRVESAYSRTDGVQGSRSERRLVRAYNRLVEAEHRWKS